MKLTIIRGIPASGKSTFAKQYLVDNPDTVRVNMDSLRLMFHNTNFNPKFEKLVKFSEMELMKIALNRNLDVIVDDTNITPNRLMNIIKQAEKYKPEIEVITIDTAFNTCNIINNLREARVPEKCMIGMFNTFQFFKETVNKRLKEININHTVIKDETVAIVYETENGICETVCPFGESINVGSLGCLKCKQFIKSDRLNQTIYCKGDK